MSNKLIQNIQKYVEQFSLFKNGDSILIALSGGADSVAMLLIFATSMSKIYNLEIAACHLNHCLRGDESDSDMKFVEELCKEKKIKLYSESIKIQKAKGCSLEENAREIRYDFFNRIAKKYSYSKIATAHHLNDQAETVLMRLLTGTGVSGLKGVRPKVNNIIRPLLTTTKSELIEYLKAYNQTFRYDSSNSNTIFKRNKIRNNLIPFLKEEFGQNIEKPIARLAMNLNEEEALSSEFIEFNYDAALVDKSNDELRFNISLLKIMPVAVLKRVLEKALEFPLSKNHIDDIRKNVISGKTGGTVMLPNNFEIKCSYSNLIIRNSLTIINKKINITIAKEVGSYYFEDLNITIKFSIMNKLKDLKYPKDNEMVAYFDYETIGDEITFKNRENGDRFYPLGSPGICKVKDFLINKKVKREARDSILTVRDDKKIFWIAGYRISEKEKITVKTTKVFVVSIVN